MRNYRLSDVFAATAGGTAGLTLSHINSVLTTVSIALGIAYLIWKWYRESEILPPHDKAKDRDGGKKQIKK
jgi:hypothetical protein